MKTILLKTHQKYFSVIVLIALDGVFDDDAFDNDAFDIDDDDNELI